MVVATHLDKANHLHSHFVLNTVSFVDGIKHHRTAKDYYEMQAVSDALCREYGLSVIENPQPGKSKRYGEWRAEQEQRPTWRGIVCSDIDEVIRQSMTERQFFENLHRKGYEVKVGKDISVRPPGKERFVRLARNFGEAYTLEGIRRRILEQSRASRPLPEPVPKNKHYRVSGNWKSCKKVTGFRALYFHYCYLLGVFPRQKTQNHKRLHFLLREDLIKLDAITQEARLLAVHRIDTAEQLSSYNSELESRIADVTSQRLQLYRKQRTVAVKSDEAASSEVSTAISTLSKELSQLRREVKLCSDIGTDGRISMSVEEKNRSWCSSSRENDQRAVTIECASDKTAPYAFNDAVYASLVNLCVDICQRNGKSKLLWLGDKNKTLAYAPKSDEMVLTVHRWFANKSCPGDWLYNRLGNLAAEVTKRLTGGSTDTGKVRYPLTVKRCTGCRQGRSRSVPTLTHGRQN